MIYLFIYFIIDAGASCIGSCREVHTHEVSEVSCMVSYISCILIIVVCLLQICFMKILCLSFF